VRFEVAPIDAGKGAAKVSGETPKTLQLPAGHYRLTMTHDGESKTTDVEVKSRAELAKSFRFGQATMAKLEGPVLRPPALLRALPQPETHNAPPLLAAVNPPPDEVDPGDLSRDGSAGAALPGLLTSPSEFQPVTLPPSIDQPVNAPPISEAEATKPETPKVGGEALASEQTPPENPAEPPSGFWKLNELFPGTDYQGYSENGRHYILYRVQKALKDKDLYSFTLDGREGKGTHRAIESYQKSTHLPPNGQLDAATLASLSLTGLPDKSEWSPPVHRSASSRSAAPQANWWERNVENPLKHVFQR